MKVGIIGSRKRTDRQTIYDYIDSLPKDTIVVSNGCYGPDKWAEDRAKEIGLPEPIIFKPDRPIPGETKYEMIERYYTRNRKIAKESDKIVAFVNPDDKKIGGTWYTIKYAKSKNIPVEIK